MPVARTRHFLPALMGSLRQQLAEGELVLEQNDGTRRIYWAGGELKYLRSDAVGEQFGNFLIRRGVLDMASLKELLADGEGARVGDRVVQWGLMTRQERDERLHELLESILLHAMEHTILRLVWNPGPLEDNLSGDLQFRLNHHWLVWDTFQNAKIERDLLEMFRSEPDWRWKAHVDLLDSLSDLPLTPTLAYALSLLGSEPLGLETIAALTGLPQDEAARLVATLWALGGLNLVQGDLPLIPKPQILPRPSAPPPPAPEPEPAILPEVEIASEPDPEFDQILLLQEDMDAPRAMPYEGVPLDLHIPEPTPPSLPPLPSEEDASAGERARRLLVKAKSYVMQDRTSEAIRALEQAIKLDGDTLESYESWMLLGRLRLSNPAWSTRAIEALQAASRLNPRAAEPWALMGELYHRKGFRANAQGCFRRALELDPSVAVPKDWALEVPAPEVQRDAQGGLMGKLRGMFGREKG